MDRRMRQSLDRYITGNYGEDQFQDEVQKMKPKERFFVTFGQSHPLRDHWVEVTGSTYTSARELVFEIFGPKFAFMYAEKDFKREYFPLGKVGFTLEAD